MRAACALVGVYLAGCIPSLRKTDPPPPAPQPYYYYPYPYPPPPQQQPPQPEPERVAQAQVTDTETPPAPPPPPSVWSLHDDSLHLAYGGGVAGTLEPNEDLEPSAMLEVQWDHRVVGIVSIGLHGHFGLRQWPVIKDAYKDLYDTDAIHDEESSDMKVLRAFGMMFGWMGAWLAGTGMFGAGPHVTFSSADAVKPWLSIGTMAAISIDTRDPEEEVVGVHGLWLAAGWDFGKVGLGVRTFYAPENGGFLAGSTGSPVASLSAHVEVVWDEAKLRAVNAKKQED